MAKQEIGKADEAQINKWKAQHKDVYQYAQTDENGNTHYTYVRKPTLSDISFAAKFADTDPIKAALSMFTNCRLGGSEEVPANDEMKQGIISKLSRLFKAVEAAEKKL